MERGSPLVAPGRAGRRAGKSGARRGGASGDHRYDAAPVAGRAGADRPSPHPGIARTADPSRAPRSRRRTGVLLGSAGALRDPSATLPVPWAETAVAAVAATAIGPVEIHCLHVPNAANGWVKPHTLRAVRAGLDVAPPMPRVVCGDLNTPRRELENGEVASSQRFAGPPAAGARQRVGRGRARRGPGSARARLPGRLPFAARLRVPRAELDLAANLRSRRGLAARPRVRFRRAGARGLHLPPHLASRRPQRPLGAGGRRGQPPLMSGPGRPPARSGRQRPCAFSPGSSHSAGSSSASPSSRSPSSWSGAGSASRRGSPAHRCSPVPWALATSRSASAACRR